jgi:hypothetical protein
MIMTLPRRKVIASFLLAFFTIPIGQVVVLGGFHFTALRILILAGLARALSFRKQDEGNQVREFCGIDWMVVLWAISTLIVSCLQDMQLPVLVNALGSLIDTLGGYFVVRSFISDGEAMQRTIKALAAICTILGVCMINEWVSHINVFGLLGGISREVTIRDGHIRSAGTLGCLYAGAFAGVLIPIFVWLWTEKKSRLAAFFGLAGASAMVVTSYSSTSWMAFMGSFVGLAFWILRKRMRLIRWGIVTTLVGLNMAMKGPVWALIARVDLTGSSSGYQRYFIVDMTIRHFRDWWLLGTQSYVNWGWDAWDLCNQFVAIALTGGLLTLVLYIWIFKRGFGAIGNARKQVNGDVRQEWLLWCLGSSMFATVVAHFGINYMAQLIMGFFVLVSCISVATLESASERIAGPRSSDQLHFACAQVTSADYPLFSELWQKSKHDVTNARFASRQLRKSPEQ